LIAASGGQIVTYHLYGSPITAPTLAQGTTPANVASIAFTYYIEGVSYSKAAVAAGTAPGNDIIVQNKYGAVAFDIDYAGTITAVEATNQAAAEFTTAALAIAAIPACATDKARMGWVTAQNTGGTFTFGTDAMATAGTVHVTFTDNTLYSAEKTKFLADTDAPTTVSHVGYIDGYFLGNELNTGRWYFSDATIVANWSALSFASAEGNPDNVVALHVASKEVALFGKKSIEFFYDDGSSPFSPIMGAFQEKGTIAPYSIWNFAGTYVFLDDERRIVALENRSITPLSGAYDNVVRDIDQVSDAYASGFTLGMSTFYVLSFPSVKRSFVLNLTTKTWSEWGSWNAPDYELWPGKSYCYATDWELHLIGDNAAGNIYKIRGDYFKWGTDNIRTLIRTGHFTSGTYEEKIEEEQKIEDDLKIMQEMYGLLEKVDSDKPEKEEVKKALPERKNSNASSTVMSSTSATDLPRKWTSSVSRL
jgi:hypothetical protein